MRHDAYILHWLEYTSPVSRRILPTPRIASLCVFGSRTTFMLYQSWIGYWFGPNLNAPRVDLKSALRSAARNASAFERSPFTARSALASSFAVSYPWLAYGVGSR